ncbi:Hypothetical protein DEACI_2083 [Acididesulfobacillus acetoxydans]|uniref:Uncharacterized protein n=1 Tax=Acididesulfobacillus acetoxydans TaxID=1561005 RepID=A0A8S0XBM8_9FIRM|nr:hypothetical protein [Acididesulfobacillus acetoxydans]CAA7601416.1 Hypothetical protein DEACI_2083 [Acididesulfobacillus acetoxydans]CEJ08847.1 Hypothetical protein DEACI_3328 [Acididesulfobacillus acetoxydans]
MIMNLGDKNPDGGGTEVHWLLYLAFENPERREIKDVCSGEDSGRCPCLPGLRRELAGSSGKHSCLDADRGILPAGSETAPVTFKAFSAGNRTTPGTEDGDAPVSVSLNKAQGFSPRIEKGRGEYWLELSGPDTVFKVMRELKDGPRVMALAPNKWLAKQLALNLLNYPAETEIGSSWYLWRGRKVFSQGRELALICFSPNRQKEDFYPGPASAGQAWQAWAKSSFWHAFPVRGLWFLTPKAVDELERLGFNNLGQLLSLGDDFLGRVTGNPYLPAYLKGGENLPGLENNYPERSLRFSADLRDPDSQNEADSIRLQASVELLSSRLVAQLAQRQQGCLRLSLTVSHAGERLSRERSFSPPQYTLGALKENATILLRTLPFPSYSEVCLEAGGLQTVSYLQYTLFAEQARLAQDPHLTALVSRFSGVLQRGKEFSRREKMLAHYDPWRFG